MTVNIDGEATESTGAYQGLRILDAATLIAGPMAAGLLGDQGAEVIKVESPGSGDPLRGYPPLVDDVSLIHKVTNRNKASVTINLRTEQGQGIFRDLAAKSDAVVVNFRPATLKKWNIDYETLAADNPYLIMLQVSAFGGSGPYSDRPGFARIAEGFSGLAHITGFSDREPVLSGYPIVDSLTGLWGAHLISGALMNRQRTGKGSLIDLSLYDGVLRLLEDLVVGIDPAGFERSRSGNTNPSVAPNDLYRTRDGEYIVLPASTDGVFRRLMKAIDHPELAVDPKLATNAGRVANRAKIDVAIQNWLNRYDRDEALTHLQASDVPAGPIMSPSEIAADEHIRIRQNLQKVWDEETGLDLLMQSPLPLGEGTAVRFPGRPLGVDTESVLSSVLGLGTDTIEHFRTAGII